jgi:hypothetical protein
MNGEHELDRVSDRIYTVLVNEAGAINSESERIQFRQFRRRHGTEYRFGGWLGFGGKFWEKEDRWYVSCYPEDFTSHRRNVIEDTNSALLALKMGP